MPSTNYERYKSRLFNFFHQQKQRWGEKVQRAARHAKVQADWSLEALLHSAVLMMRKVIESRGKRLKPGNNQDNSSTSTEYTGTQQQELISSQGNTNPSLPHPADNQLPGIETQILPPPQGAIAFFDTAIAKFESNALVPFSRSSGELLALIQTQFKIFVYGEKAVEKDKKQQKNEFQELISTALNSLFIRNQNHIEQLRINLDKETPATPLPSKTSSTLNLESKEIVDPWLTPDDLFGSSQETPTEEEKAQTSNNTPNPSKNPPRNWRNRYQKFLQQPEPDIELDKKNPSTPLPSKTSSTFNLESQEIVDPWLTLNDLFGNSQETLTEEEKEQTSNNTPNPSQNSPRNWRNRYQKFLQQPEPDIELVKQQPSSINIASAATSSELDTTNNNQLEANSDFVETQAKIVGYAQHPLEKILKWLDNGMLWLEEKIITAFNFIQGLWRKK